MALENISIRIGKLNPSDIKSLQEQTQEDGIMSWIKFDQGKEEYYIAYTPGNYLKALKCAAPYILIKKMKIFFKGSSFKEFNLGKPQKLTKYITIKKPFIVDINNNTINFIIA